MQKQTEINQNADKIAGQKVFADDGFYFGIGAFETIAVEDGVPQLLAWHLERLRKSLAFFKIAQTVEEQEVNTWLKAVLIELDCTILPINPRARIKKMAKITPRILPKSPLNAAWM